MKKGIEKVLAAVAGAGIGAIAVTTRFVKLIEQRDDNKTKLEEFYYILNKWLEVKQKGKCLSEFFHDNDYKTVAIYGTKELGVALYRELKDSDIQVLYGIDQNPSDVFDGVKVYTPKDKLPKVDVIVVTAPHYYNSIEDVLYENVDYPVVSIEDVVCEVDY